MLEKRKLGRLGYLLVTVNLVFSCAKKTVQVATKTPSELSELTLRLPNSSLFDSKVRDKITHYSLLIKSDDCSEEKPSADIEAYVSNTAIRKALKTGCTYRIGLQLGSGPRANLLGTIFYTSFDDFEKKATKISAKGESIFLSLPLHTSQDAEKNGVKAALAGRCKKENEQYKTNASGCEDMQAKLVFSAISHFRGSASGVVNGKEAEKYCQNLAEGDAGKGKWQLATDMQMLEQISEGVTEHLATLDADTAKMSFWVKRGAEVKELFAKNRTNPENIPQGVFAFCVRM